MTDELLVGSNVATLVAAALLADAGHHVTLLTDGRPLGGHFRGLSLDEGDFDLGMVLIERADPAIHGPLSARQDWVRDGEGIDEVIQSQAQLVKVPTPECLFDGKRWPDPLIANRLDLVTHSGFDPPAPLPRDDPHHAAGKAASAYDLLSYTDAAGFNHGNALHRRLIEPFVFKLLGTYGRDLLARHHRAAWVPLLWPETVIAAVEGRPTGLPEYPFWTTSSGFVGDVVRRLTDHVDRHARVDVHRAMIQGVVTTRSSSSVRTRDGGTWSADRLAMGTSAERTREFLGLPLGTPGPCAPVLLVCCLVREAAVTTPVACLFVVDEDYAAYRITDQDRLARRDPLWHRVVIEGGSAAFEGVLASPSPAARLVGELRRLLGVVEQDDVRVVKVVSSQRALQIPTAAAVAKDQETHAMIHSMIPQATLTGTLRSFGAASLNEQIAQAIDFAGATS